MVLSWYNTQHEHHVSDYISAVNWSNKSMTLQCNQSEVRKLVTVPDVAISTLTDIPLLCLIAPQNADYWGTVWTLCLITVISQWKLAVHLPPPTLASSVYTSQNDDGWETPPPQPPSSRTVVLGFNDGPVTPTISGGVGTMRDRKRQKDGAASASASALTSGGRRWISWWERR